MPPCWPARSEPSVVAVYVDQAREREGNATISHLLADTLEELHSMADRIGLNPIAFHPGSIPYYDCAQGKRQQAIKLGAIVIGRQKVRELIQTWKNMDAASA